MLLLAGRLIGTVLLGLGAAGESGSENRAWLGVMLSPVPQAVARQLDLGDAGIMVTNVASGSPAAEAGIKQYDIIVELNGQEVSGDYAEFAERIRAVGPGHEAALVVIRGGEKTKLAVKLAEMPEEGEIKYEFEGEPDVVTELEDEVTGKILERGPGGKWTIRDLGELKGLEKLRDSFKELEELKELEDVLVLPDFEGAIELRIESDGEHREARVTREGKTCEVQVDKEGKITVRKTRREGDSEQSSEKTYASGDELKEADEEAYEIYKQLTKGKGEVMVLTPKAFAAPGLRLRLHEEIRKHLEEARRHAQQAQEQARQAHEDAGKHMFTWRWAPPAWSGKGWPDPQAFFFQAHKPQTSFVVKEDGRIVVTTRKADAEVVREFRNADDLKERAPELHEKFKDVRESE